MLFEVVHQVADRLVGELARSASSPIRAAPYRKGTTGYNVARQAALRAGLPITVPGGPVTVDGMAAAGLFEITQAGR